MHHRPIAGACRPLQGPCECLMRMHAIDCVSVYRAAFQCCRLTVCNHLSALHTLAVQVRYRDGSKGHRGHECQTTVCTSPSMHGVHGLLLLLCFPLYRQLLLIHALRLLLVWRRGHTGHSSSVDQAARSRGLSIRACSSWRGSMGHARVGLLPLQPTTSPRLVHPLPLAT